MILDATTEPDFAGAPVVTLDGVNILGTADGLLFDDAAPLFPFGHGLSYTTFEIGAPELPAARVPAGDAVDVSVTVANTGDRGGDEVVQLLNRHWIITDANGRVEEVKGPAATVVLSAVADSLDRARAN